MPLLFGSVGPPNMAVEAQLRTNKPHLAIVIRGHMGVRVFGCLGVWVFGCLGVWMGTIRERYDT